MKKVIVISDTHGNTSGINKVIGGDFDYLFFLGDCVSDLGTLVNDPRVKVVRGNCDFFSAEKRDLIVQVEDMLMFLTHGDEYGVKMTLSRLYDKVKELQPALVLFGHTHRAEDVVYNGIRFVNPGALSSVRGGVNSYLVINIDGDKYFIEKCTI